VSACTNPFVNFWGSFERDEFLDQPSVPEERTCSVERHSSHDSCSCNVWRYATCLYFCKRSSAMTRAVSRRLLNAEALVDPRTVPVEGKVAPE
jgi:hypothetical protein